MDYNYNDYNYQNTDYNNGSGGPGMNYQGGPDYSDGKKPEKPKKKHPWLRVVAMALVFGLIAGGTAFVTNYTARAVSGSGAAVTSGKASNSSGGTSKSSTSDSQSSGSGSSTAGDTSVETVASTAMPSMVTISTMSVQEMQNYFGQSQQYEVSGAGSGVIVGENDDEYLIATNEHVVSGAQELSVGFIDESVVSASIKGTDSDNDLAVIAVNKSDVSDDTKNQISIIKIGDSDSLQLGERVVAIGNALGYGQSVTSGYVSALNRTLETSDGTKSEGLIQTDAAINPGNSGGALLNMDGELVGINEGKSTSTNGTTVDNMGYAIPTAKAEPILDNLMQQETKTVVSEDERGYLGISGADVTSQYAEVYNMPEGICIITANDGGAAANAGLKKGDVITKINDQSVSTLDELKEQLQYYKAGDSVTITAERADNGEYKEQTFTVTLESKSDLDSQSSQQSQDGSSQSQQTP
jgi:serine protease Do